MAFDHGAAARRGEESALLAGAEGGAVCAGEELDPAEVLARRFAHRVGFFSRRVARHFMLGTRWQDELESAGWWGLAKALANRRGDASPEELSAYVSRRIEGAVIDAARQCLDRSRRLEEGARFVGAEAAGDGEPWETGAAGDEVSTPEELTERQRLREHIHRALAELEPDQRRWIHEVMAGATLAEIAESEGLSPGTLRVRFDRAARRLRGRARHIRRAILEGEA